MLYSGEWISSQGSPLKETRFYLVAISPFWSIVEYKRTNAFLSEETPVQNVLVQQGKYGFRKNVSHKKIAETLPS